MVRRAFAPLLLSLVHEEQQLLVWLVNDTPDPVSGTIRLTLFDFDGTPLHSKNVSAAAPPNSSVLAATKPLQELGFLDATRHFIYARMPDKGRTVVETAFLLARFREVKFSRTRVAWEVRKVGQQTFEVEMRSKAFAKAVCLETKAAVDYSDNFVDLVPSARKSIVITTRRDIDLEEFKSGLKVSNGIFS